MRLDFGSMEWQETPYAGVYVHCIEQSSSFSGHAVRLAPGGELALHYHEREEGRSDCLCSCGAVISSSDELIGRDVIRGIRRFMKEYCRWRSTG